MIVGYTRAANSTGDIGKQVHALAKFGCQKIYQDIGHGTKLDRPSYTKMMTEIQPGDIVMVYRLDRLSGHPEESKEIVRQLFKNSIGFISLVERINTTTGENTSLFSI